MAGAFVAGQPPRPYAGAETGLLQFCEASVTHLNHAFSHRAAPGGDMGTIIARSTVADLGFFQRSKNARTEIK